MKLLRTIRNDIFEILPPMIFFLIAFNLVLVTKQLILREYGISWTGFGAAFIGAYLIGKVVLIVDKLPFANRFPGRRLICKASWKCLIYFLAAVLVQYMEHIVPLLLRRKGIMEAHRLFLSETVWPHFWLVQMWVAVLFFVYCATRELVRVIGRDEIVSMLFGNRNDAD